MRHTFRVLGLVFALCLLLAGCGGGTTTGNNNTGSTKSSSTHTTLKVFAAASLTESFNDIKTKYQAAHPDVNITYNFNGSQILVQQIINGAPADVFASADQANMQKGTQAGVVNSPQLFAKNKLTVIVPTNNPANITSLKDLARKGVKIDLEAATVPAGKYSRQILDKLGSDPQYGAAYKSAVLANIVSQEDNVKAVVQKVELGEADAGIVYVTDVTKAAASKVKFITIPDNFNVIAQYPIAAVKDSKNAQAAQDFINYILSPDGQAVLNQYHFITVSGNGA